MDPTASPNRFLLNNAELGTAVALLSCIIHTPTELQSDEVTVFRKEDGQLGVLRQHQDLREIVPLSGIEEAAHYVEQSLGLPEPTTQPESATIELDLVGYAALLAGADVLQATALRARLGRSHITKPVLTPALLESELEKGSSHGDKRWAVACGRHMCPVDLTATAGRMEQGLAALRNAALTEPVSRGQVLTNRGEQVTNMLTDATKTAGLTMSVMMAGEWITLANTFIFASPKEIWIGKWSDVSSEGGNVRMTRTDAAGVREHIQGLLRLESKNSVRAADDAHTPVTASPTTSCTQCGNPFASPTAKFCKACGAPRAKPATAEHRCSNPRCGKVMAPGRKFCTSCGTPMSHQGD